jgi:DNA-binding transcriptional LysR family regulator
MDTYDGGVSQIHRLELFLEFLRQGSIRAVASSRSYSASNVSHQLAVLSTEAGTELLTREGTRLVPTPAGTIFARHAERIVAEWEAARSVLAELTSALSGTLTIGAFQSAMISAVPELLTRLGEQAPELAIVVVQAEPSQALVDVHHRRLDLAIVERYPGAKAVAESDLAIDTVGTDEMFVLPPRGCDATSLADLAGQPWILEYAGSVAHEWGMSMCAAAGFTPRVVIRSSDLVVEENFALRGLAAAFLPSLIWLGRPRPETAIPFRPAQRREIQTVTRLSMRRHPAVELVRRELTEILETANGR